MDPTPVPGLAGYGSAGECPAPDRPVPKAALLEHHGHLCPPPVHRRRPAPADAATLGYTGISALRMVL